MNHKIFQSEQAYALIFIVLAVISGWVFDQWLLSFFLWSIIYIIWKWLEFYIFYQWYKRGLHADKLPLVTGIWGDLCTLVIKENNHFEKTKQNNQRLINQFNATAQALPYATLLLNEQFMIKWINKASANILGIVQHQDENNRIDNIIRDPKFVALLNAKNSDSEIQLQHPLDASKKILIKLINLSDQRYLLVARDISEQESLRKSRKAFVDNASHELRTPLTVIAGYLEMLQTAEDVPPQWQTAINQALQQSNRMERIINDMLKLSSIEHERYLEADDATINMSQKLNRLLNDVKNSSHAKGHVFSANIDSKLSIQGNREEITGVVLNLLNNAVIHTQPGTDVSLKWFKKEGQAHLWICDTGAGIEAKHLAHLTERFYRVDNSRDQNTNSTGLGLAIVKQICDNHNAKLTIESELQKGTCFKIEFPASRIVDSSSY